MTNSFLVDEIEWKTCTTIDITWTLDIMIVIKTIIYQINKFIIYHHHAWQEIDSLKLAEVQMSSRWKITVEK